MRDPANPHRHLSTKGRREYKIHLFEKQDGKCIWCKGEMVLTFENLGAGIRGNVATFEHLEDSYSPNGRTSVPGTIALSCADCNNLRNAARERKVIDALRRKYGDTFHELLRGTPTEALIKMLKEQGVDPFA